MWRHPSLIIAAAAIIAVIIFATLTGSAALTLWIGFAANRIGRRHVLLAACALMFATGAGLLW